MLFIPSQFLFNLLYKLIHWTRRFTLIGISAEAKPKPKSEVMALVKPNPKSRLRVSIKFNHNPKHDAGLDLTLRLDLILYL